MRGKPLIVGLIIAVIGGVLVYYNIFTNKYISWGVLGFGVLVFIIGLLIGPRRTGLFGQLPPRI